MYLDFNKVLASCVALKFMLFAILESNDEILLKLTRWAQKAIGHLEGHLSTADWLRIQSR